jgi:hypothetical protein
MALARKSSLARILGSAAMLPIFVSAAPAEAGGSPAQAERGETASPTPGDDLLPFGPLAVPPAGTLRIGGYVGALSQQGYLNTLYSPWRTRLEPNYLADIHAVYTIERFVDWPLDLELEAGLAKRFGLDHQAEVDIAPVFRWKQFPWNEHLYTNLRVGPLGASYVNSISSWEQENSENGRGSRFLNFLVSELTFAPAADSSWEGLVTIHHRSGIYSLINDVQGGSNYISAGVRFVAF